MAISQDKARLIAIIDKETESKLIDLAKQEKRSKSSMASVLIEEAIENRKK